MQNPHELGYSMPAEWESHEGTWLSWPKNPLTFPSETIAEVEQIYVQMISALSSGEKVRLLVDDVEAEKKVRSLLPSEKNVEFYKIKSADVWVRDYGPFSCEKRTRMSLPQSGTLMLGERSTTTSLATTIQGWKSRK